MHWNETSWSRYPSPSRDLVPVTSNGVTSKIKVDELKGIGAAPGGAYPWAVGSTERMDTQSQTLVLAYANRVGGCASPTDTVEATVQVKPTATNISSGTPGVAAIQMQPVRTIPAKWANIMAWSPDGSILSTAETDRVQTDTNAPPTRTLEVKLYSMPTGQLLSQATYTNVQALAWSPDSQMLAVGLDRNTIKVLDRSGREPYTLSTPMPDMQSAAQADKESAAWEWAGMSNGGYVRSLAWSPEGHLLASAANDPYSIDPVSPDGAIRI